MTLGSTRSTAKESYLILARVAPHYISHLDRRVLASESYKNITRVLPSSGEVQGSQYLVAVRVGVVGVVYAAGPGVAARGVHFRLPVADLVHVVPHSAGPAELQDGEPADALPELPDTDTGYYSTCQEREREKIIRAKSYSYEIYTTSYSSLSPLLLTP